MTPFEAVRQSLWFAGLTDQEIRALSSNPQRTRILNYADDEAVLNAQEPSPHALFVVISGGLDVVRTVERQHIEDELRIRRYMPGEVVGVLEVIKEEAHNQATVRAVGPTQVVKLSIPDFRACLREFPALGHSFCVALANTLLEDGQTIVETKLLSAAQRLARALQAEQKRVEAQEKKTLVVFGDKQRLAKRLHLQPVTIGNLLRKFAQYGALDIVKSYTRDNKGTARGVATMYALASSDKLKAIAAGVSGITSTQSKG